LSLLDSVTDCVIDALPFDRSNPEAVAALNEKHPGELLALYHNWRRRRIAAQPRQVMRSNEFVRNPVARERSDTIEQIVRDIEYGSDLTKYLSRRVRFGFALPRKSDKKDLYNLQYLDLLLNEWEIHHLHISTTLEADGFVEWGYPLLFAIFRPSRAYLIEVKTHDDFADDTLVRIAIENWPTDELFLELMGIGGVRNGSPHSNEDRKKMRSAGVSSFIQIGDRVFVPPGGISTAGTSSLASLWSMSVMRTLKQFEEDVQKDPSQIVALIRQHGGKPDENPTFKFSLFAEGFGVVEATSGMPIGLSA
jgi:hypothetical protein